MYNYREAIKNDIRDVLSEYDTRDFDSLYDSLWVDDSVTGNGSGSYTFNTATAKEYVMGNEDLVQEVCMEFCIDPVTIANRFMNGDYEWFDVSIRCYLLGECLSEVLEEMEEE